MLIEKHMSTGYTLVDPDHPDYVDMCIILTENVLKINVLDIKNIKTDNFSLFSQFFLLYPVGIH